MSTRDRRVSLVNEVLGSIRFVKFMAFERPFEERILKARGDEIRELRRNFFLEIAFQGIYSISPILVRPSLILWYSRPSRRSSCSRSDLVLAVRARQLLGVHKPAPHGSRAHAEHRLHRAQRLERAASASPSPLGASGDEHEADLLLLEPARSLRSTSSRTSSCPSSNASSRFVASTPTSTRPRSSSPPPSRTRPPSPTPRRSSTTTTRSTRSASRSTRRPSRSRRTAATRTPTSPRPSRSNSRTSRSSSRLAS